MRNLLVPFGLRPKKPDTWPRYVDGNDRAMAGAIDIMLLYFLLSGISAYINTKVFAYYAMTPLGAAPVHSFSEAADMFWAVREPWLVSNGIVVLMMGVFVIACQLAYQTTPGKWLLGLKVVRRETFEPIAPWRYILRFVGYFASGLPLMIGFFWIGFNKKRRGFHDYIADTVVIHTRPKGWYWHQLKRGYCKLRGKPAPAPLPMEQPVSQPAAEQGHEDRSKPVE